MHILSSLNSYTNTIVEYKTFTMYMTYLYTQWTIIKEDIHHTFKSVPGLSPQYTAYNVHYTRYVHKGSFIIIIFLSLPQLFCILLFGVGTVHVVNTNRIPKLYYWFLVCFWKQGEKEFLNFFGEFNPEFRHEFNYELNIAFKHKFNQQFSHEFNHEFNHEFIQNLTILGYL